MIQVLITHADDAHYLLATSDLLVHLQNDHGIDMEKFDLDADTAAAYLADRGVDMDYIDTTEDVTCKALHELLHTLHEESGKDFALLYDRDPWTNTTWVRM